MKYLVRILIIWGVLIIPSLLGLRGCGTQPLYDAAIRADGAVDHYSKAYINGNTLIVSYSTQVRHAYNYTLPATDNWAEVCLDPKAKEVFKIHRESFPEGRFSQLPKVQNEDITNSAKRNAEVDPVVGPKGA